MSAECGCRACFERDALIRQEMAEHVRDFERYWEAMHTPRMPPLDGDHETRALQAVTDLYGRFDGSTFLPVPVVKAVPG